MKKYDLTVYTQKGFPARENKGSHIAPEKGIVIFLNGEEREAYFFGVDSLGDAIWHTPVEIENVLCIPQQVRWDGKVTDWNFNPEVPKPPRGYAKVKHGQIMAEVFEGQTIGMQRAHRTEYIFNGGEWKLSVFRGEM